MPFARSTDPSTSHEAANSVRHVTATQNAILRLLMWPKTDDELIDAYYGLASAGGAPNASPSGVRSRRAELVKLGLVVDSGDRVRTVSGRNAIVWKCGETIYG